MPDMRADPRQEHYRLLHSSGRWKELNLDAPKRESVEQLAPDKAQSEEKHAKDVVLTEDEIVLDEVALLDCAWCNKELKSRQKRFCSSECRQESKLFFRKDERRFRKMGELRDKDLRLITRVCDESAIMQGIRRSCERLIPYRVKTSGGWCELEVSGAAAIVEVFTQEQKRRLPPVRNRRILPPETCVQVSGGGVLESEDLVTLTITAGPLSDIITKTENLEKTPA